MGGAIMGTTILYFMPSLFTSLGSHVISLDQKTGTVQWETEILPGRSQLVAHQKNVYVVVESLSKRRLFVLDAKNGKIVQETTLEGSGQAPTLLVEDGRVFVTCGGVASAFTLEGVLLWKNEFKGKGNGAMGMSTLERDRQADEY